MPRSFAKQTAADLREFLAAVKSGRFLPAYILTDLEWTLANMPADGLPPELVKARGELETYTESWRVLMERMKDAHRKALAELETMPSIRGRGTAMNEARAGQKDRVDSILSRLLADESRAALENAVEPIRLLLAEYRLGYWAVHDQSGRGDK